MNDGRHCAINSYWSQLRAWHVMALAVGTVWLNVFEAPPLTLLAGMLLGWALFTTLLFVYYRETRGLAWLALACLVMSILLFPKVAAAEEVKKIAQCGLNLRQIGVALQTYHQEYDCFPPPYVADSQGRPLYSWRVLVLPYLGERSLYDQWRLDESWDSVHNRALARQPLRVFRCPAAEDHLGDSETATTNYVAVVGQGMAWEEGKSLSLNDFPDGTWCTIMVVEVRGSDVRWAEPADLYRATMSLRIDDEPKPSLGSYHRPGTPYLMVLFANGSVTYLRDRSEAEVEAFLTRDGGERVDR